MGASAGAGGQGDSEITGPAAGRAADLCVEPRRGVLGESGTVVLVLAACSEPGCRPGGGEMIGEEMRMSAGQGPRTRAVCGPTIPSAVSPW
jgi:hypothetical protein